MEIRGQIVGADTVIARLQGDIEKTPQRVGRTVHRLGLSLLAKVKEVYLSGAALNTRSGRLRRSANEKFTENGTTFLSSVGTNVSYGRAWELGFDRKIGAGARGGPRNPMTNLAAAKYLAKHPPGMKHEEARPFLQPALADMKDEIRASLAGSVSGRA